MTSEAMHGTTEKFTQKRLCASDEHSEKSKQDGTRFANRHVQIIAIANHSGRNLGAGRSTNLTGPSIILIYMLTGVFMYLMMRANWRNVARPRPVQCIINFITKYFW